MESISVDRGRHESSLVVLASRSETWREMLDEHNALEIRELQQRVSDLERETGWVRDIMRAALDVAHELARERDALKLENAALRARAGAAAQVSRSVDGAPRRSEGKAA